VANEQLPESACEGLTEPSKRVAARALAENTVAKRDIRFGLKKSFTTYLPPKDKKLTAIRGSVELFCEGILPSAPLKREGPTLLPTVVKTKRRSHIIALLLC
jgi:hypothetical protein